MEKDLDYLNFFDGLIEEKTEKKIIELLLENREFEEIIDILVTEHREGNKNANL